MLVLAAAFVLLGIGTPLLGMAAFAGTDLFQGKAPWNALLPTGYTAQNPYVGDTVDTNIPQLHAFAERLRDGDFASWWSLNLGGGELGSVPSDSVLSPLSLPYLLLPTWLAPGYSKLLEMAVAVAGVFLFARRIGLARPAGMLGGVVFVSGAFMVAWTNWPHTKVAAFVPLLFWALERLVQRRRIDDLVPLSLIVAAMLLGGFPAVTAYALVAAAAYTVLRLVTTDRWQPARLGKAALVAIGGVALGVGVAAFQLVPFARELGAIALGSRSQSANSHSAVESMITMVAPQALGGTNPTVSRITWFGLGHPVEEMSYVGAAALLLALVGLVARRRPGVPPMVRGFFVTCALGTGVVIFLGGPLLVALQQLPVFDTNYIGRARSMLGFFVAVLAAIGFDALLTASRSAWRSPARRIAWRGYAVAIGVVTCGAGLAVTRLAHQLAFQQGELEWFDAEVREAAIFAGLALLALALALLGRGVLKSVGLLLLPALIVVQALLVVWPYWPRVEPELFYPTTATHEFLASEIGTDRLVSAGAMQTGTEAYYGLRTVGGRAFVAESYGELLRAWCDECFVAPGYMVVPPRRELLDDPLLDRLGARFLVMDPASPVNGIGEVVGEPTGVMDLHPGRTVTLAVPAGGVRAAGVDLAEPFEPADPWASLEIVARDAGGGELASAERRFFTGAGAGAFVVALEELDPATPATIDITLSADRPMTVRAAGDQPLLALVRPTDDGLRLVHSSGAVVYERLGALPRLRWAATATVEPDQERALDLVLASTTPDVVLSRPGSPGSGLPAELTVREDSGDVIEVDVDAPGSGYLVVADGLQDRWTAEVDGVEVELRDADHGYVAVEVPGGQHRVRLAYQEPLNGLGLGVSAVAALGLVAFVTRSRLRRRPSATT